MPVNNNKTRLNIWYWIVAFAVIAMRPVPGPDGAGLFAPAGN